MTSERTRVAVRAGYARRAKLPAFACSRCLRRVLISLMLAPQRSSREVRRCRSSRVKPGVGEVSKADPPPEMRKRTRSLSPALSEQLHDLPGGAHAAPIRDGVPGGEDLHAGQVSLVAVLDQDDALRQALAQNSRLRQRAMGAPALPTATRVTFSNSSRW